MEFEDVEEWISKNDQGLENEFFSDEEIIAIASKDACEDNGKIMYAKDLGKNLATKKIKKLPKFCYNMLRTNKIPLHWTC